jgi:AAA+ ATPase superfamily predicted ATPase
MFFNRIDELAALSDNWTANAARFFVIWGRRRVGKTELLTHFSADKRALYFEATEGVLADQLGDLSAELARVSGNELLRAQPVTSWDAALVAIEQFVGSKRTIVILDEFQYLATQDAGLGSTINRWWRTTGRNLPIVLVLAGSEVGFFEREVLAGSMYGRRTGQLQLLPFSYRDAARFHPDYSAEDRIRAYAVCGGMPYYLERFADDLPLREHILHHALYRDGFLFEEADLVLRQELPDPRNYIAVLRAIAQGQTQNSKIANRTGLDDSQVSQTVKTLARMQLVRVNRPVTATERSKKTSYTIVDGFLNFYFRFVDPAKSRLRSRADAKRYVDEVVMAQLDHFVSKPAFELLCQEYVREQEQAAGVGSWWGPVPTGEGRQTCAQEIDIVAVAHDATVTATGSCKWTSGKMDFGEETLLRHVEPSIPGAGAVARHYFFSRSGFTDQLHKLADSEPGRYRLVTPEDIYR